MRGSLEIGTVSSFAYDAASRTLYAGTSTNDGVFRSLDGGKSWEQPFTSLLRGSIIRSLAVLPNGIVYAVRATFPPAPSSNLFRSSDHGDTWTSVPGSPAAEAMAVDSESSTIYVVAGASVMASAELRSTAPSLFLVTPSPCAEWFARQRLSGRCRPSARVSLLIADGRDVKIS